MNANGPAALRGALKPGGRLSFACFREAVKNTYVMVPLAGAMRLGGW